MLKRFAAAFLAMLLVLGAAGCAKKAPEPSAEPSAVPSAEPEKNGEVYILYTSDVHCGVGDGFGYAGLQQIRDGLEARGYETILVDDGDSIQGEAIGSLTKGETMIELMDVMGYDAAIPGNHEFDYGVDRFLDVASQARFPYISCNFNREGELLFAPYIIKEAAGRRIAFVGVTTPNTVTTSTPAFFQNDAGEYIYGFMADESGEELYSAVQSAVDSARAEGAELVYVLAHLGYYEEDHPWNYADVIANTTGIDVMLDGHSHDTEQVVMKNKNGEDVVRSACGTKLACVGYSHIGADGQIVETGIWKWPNSASAADVFGFSNSTGDFVDAALRGVEEQLGSVVARSDAELTIFEPEAFDSSGDPVRMVRRAETNLGDFCADAYRIVTGSDIGLSCGGGIRTNISRGDITYNDIISVHPFGNQICVIKATGQQILDALEWGARAVPSEFGGFLQVSGLSYEIDVAVPSGCRVGENNMFAGVEGRRRVRSVTVGGEPIDPDGEYTVAGCDYTLILNGDGHTAFDGAEVLRECVMLDSDCLITYVTDTLGGEIGGQYADPYGGGRITMIEDGSDPDALDYSDPANWAYFEPDAERDVDVFIVCPTVDTRSETNSFDLNDKLKGRFVSALDMERGIFDETGRMFSPYYRQMSINAYLLPESEREQARAVAYRDVREAFRWYLENVNGGRAVILAGFSQGGEMCLDLMKEFFGDEDLRDRLVAVYALGWRVTEDDVAEYPQIVPACGETETGVVVSFDCEDGSLTGTIIIPEGVKTFSINPLNWKTDSTPADASLNLGAVMGTGAEPIPGLCGAYISGRGELVVTGVTPEEYPPGLDVFPEGAYHLYDYMFFFENLKKNVADRTAAWLAQ